jgi:prolipoprotein diacylglyceryl transferase
LFVCSFIFGFYILKKIFDKEGVKIEMLDKLTMYMLIATILGARLGHCLFYQPDYYLKRPLEILKIWEGGLASHGAAIAIILAIYIFSRKYKELGFFWILDRLVIVVALSGFFIRMGNLMNSEIIGKGTSLPWAFIFERLNPPDQFPRHPSQLYEALSYFALFVYLLWYYYRNVGKFRDGWMFGLFMVLLFALRFFIEFLKEPQVNFEQNLTLNLGQLLSIPFILIGLLLLYYKRGTKTEE